LSSINFTTMQTTLKFVTIVFLVLVSSCGANKAASDNVKIENRIFDNAHILTDVQEDSVFGLIQKLENDIGSQIAVLTIDSLREEKLEDFSLRTARDLRIGRATHNDGILITIVFGERKTRIEVGTGLENIVTDEIAAALLSDDLAPRFRAEKYGQGIYVTVDKLSKLIRENEKLVGKGTEPK
jgi:uncharacterized membrane protein YgcG